MELTGNPEGLYFGGHRPIAGTCTYRQGGKYIQLHKIGLSYKEIKKPVTVEIGILFLLPFVVAVLHSSFALAALQNLFLIEVTSGAFLVMGSFLLVQILYYLFIRGKYLSEIEEHLME